MQLQKKLLDPQWHRVIAEEDLINRGVTRAMTDILVKKYDKFLQDESGRIGLYIYIHESVLIGMINGGCKKIIKIMWIRWKQNIERLWWK